MSVKGFKSHPYIPNSVPEVEQEMLHEIGLTSLEELHEEVPDEIILKENMDLPEAFGSEYELRRHVEKLLKKNSSCADNLNFLGAGCYQHYVPAICDEINGKGEFLTAYGGESYNDFGRFQSLFEYESMMAELLDMEVVNVPTMDYAQAAATAIRMGSRVAGRTGVLVPGSMDREKLAVVKNYCTPDLQIEEIKCDDKTGCIDLADLATMDDPTYVLEFPSRLFGICRTNTEGEYAFADVAYDRTSFGHLRDKAKEYVGTQTALWGITAGVYLATMGPQGMQEVGETIMQNAQYAAKQLAALPNVSLRFSAPFFKEFVLDFSKTGKTVAEINKALLEKHIFGGKDLSRDFPALGQCAMYCVTEVHTKEDIDTLVSALSEIL